MEPGSYNVTKQVDVSDVIILSNITSVSNKFTFVNTGTCTVTEYIEYMHVNKWKTIRVSVVFFKDIIPIITVPFDIDIYKCPIIYFEINLYWTGICCLCYNRRYVFKFIYKREILIERNKHRFTCIWNSIILYCLS